ncbi:MAG: DUF1700 domain-containing protein [Oscillospiraceae bacterium]
MNKQQFLAAIGEQIQSLPPGDVEKSLDYYCEMIDDRMEDGLSEEEAVAALGSPEEIAAQILMETPLPKLVKAKLKPSRALKAWEIVLLVLGSPVWLPLLLAAGIIVLAVYIVLWAVIVVLYAVDLSFAAAAVGGIAGLFLLLYGGIPVQAVLFLGGGLVCAGLAILLFFAFNQVTRCLIGLSKMPVHWIKGRFIGKGEAK